MASDPGNAATPGPRPGTPSAKARILDVGVGDAEAPANAIPNIIAHLVETETWRNAATILMGTLLLGLGYWAYSGVRQSIAATQVLGLQALLGTVASGIDVWVGEHRAETERLAKQSWLAGPAIRLAARAARDPGDPRAGCKSADAMALSEMLRSRLGVHGVIAYLVVDRTGLVVASENPASCGQRMHSASFRSRLDRALDGGTQFVRPYPDIELSIEGVNGRRRPVAWTIAAVGADGGPATVALAVGTLADHALAAVFTAARSGISTEAYAFAADGFMLTPSRFADDLVAAGALPDEGPVPSAFVIPVRDPGGDLAAGHRPALEAAARPLTQPAALALAARGKSLDEERQGVITGRYRSYRGSEVIGAWRWLPQYDIGIVAERSAAEAFAAMRYLWISFAVIGAFTVLMLGAALSSGVSLSQLQRQFGRMQRLGAYTLERQLSEGGMADIYLARHALLKRPTAIKVLKKSVATDEFIRRFEREVQAASQLLHPNTVRIYDFGRTREGQPYYVMEYLDGMTLAELVTRFGPAPPGRAIHVLRQVAAALREAHEHGLIHRDVKPENVMLCRRGEDDVVKLLDFGLVKNLETAQTSDITRQIRILGTPRYMAPERILNPSDVDARADIYALGAVGYFLLTGRPVFEGEDNVAIGQQVLHAPAPRASAGGATAVPEGLDALIAACLEKDRLRRPQSMAAVIDTLDGLASRLAWTQRDAAAWWDSHREAGASPPEA
jgi:serine/threonine-protein kinase